jgi:ketosteroid isomerase-like protein
MQRAAIRELIETWYDAHKHADFAFFDRILADDVEWTMHGPPQAFPVPNSLYGKRAVLDAIAQVHEALYVVRNVQREVMIDGDRAAVISDRTVVQRATGRTMVYRVAAFLRFRGDKLVSYQSFYDSFDMLEQVIGQPLEVPDTYPRAE